MRKLLLLALLLSPLAVHAQQKPACAVPEHRQFDFWLGTWEVTTPDGKLPGRTASRPSPAAARCWRTGGAAAASTARA
jgi:hypothetical protein